jgi:hypothetical protein
MEKKTSSGESERGKGVVKSRKIASYGVRSCSCETPLADMVWRVSTAKVADHVDDASVCPVWLATSPAPAGWPLPDPSAAVVSGDTWMLVGPRRSSATHLTSVKLPARRLGSPPPGPPRIKEKRSLDWATRRRWYRRCCGARRDAISTLHAIHSHSTWTLQRSPLAPCCPSARPR